MPSHWSLLARFILNILSVGRLKFTCFIWAANLNLFLKGIKVTAISIACVRFSQIVVKLENILFFIHKIIHIYACLPCDWGIYFVHLQTGHKIPFSKYEINPAFVQLQDKDIHSTLSLPYNNINGLYLATFQMQKNTEIAIGNASRTAT